MFVDSVPASGIANAEVPPALRDGYEIHRAALRSGLDVVLYPRQVLVANHPGGGPELAFVHGIPQSSSLSAVTYAQDKRMRRELLARAGLPVPAGASFAIGHEIRRARRFARHIGYPVVVKPAVGDNLGDVFPGLLDEAQLDAAIDFLRTPEADRPGFTRTAYGLTLLLEPGEENGRAVAPAGYQFLVEQHVSGQYLRLLVLGDEVISAVDCPGGPHGRSGESGRAVTEELHPSLRVMALGAVQAVPGLAVAAVDLVVDDHRRAAVEQPAWVVEFSERPWLAVQAGVAEELSNRIGEAILSHHAAARAVALDAARDRVAVDFRVEGATDPAGSAAVLLAAIEAAGLAGTAEIADPVEGTVGGSLEGGPDELAWIIESLLDGSLDGQRAMLAEVRQRRLTRPNAGDRAAARVATGRVPSPDGWRPEDLERLLPGRWITRPPAQWRARSVATRRAGCRNPQTLFVAIDRETYLRSTGNKGIYARWSDTHGVVASLGEECVGAVVQRPVDGLPAGLPQYLVDDSYAAVLTLARKARDRLGGNVIAITGTVGKSSVKDMLAHSLSVHGSVIATRGNENTRSGVPLTLANTVTNPDFVVLEVAQSALWGKGSGVGPLIRPHIAVVTEIGITQASRVASEAETARVKSKIAEGVAPGGYAVLNRDMAEFDLVQSEVQRYGARVVTYGFSSDAEVRVDSWEPQPMTSTVRLTARDETVELTVPAPGRGMVSNALAAVSVAMLCGLDLQRVAADIGAFSLPDAKLLPLRYPLADGELIVIDDSYSAAPLAMRGAFEVAGAFPIASGGRRIAVLGRMVDLGAQAERLHRELAGPLLAAGFQLVITHGEEMQHLREALPDGILGPHCEDAESCAEAVLAVARGGDLVLIKGSRRASGFAGVGKQVRQSLDDRTSSAES